ncbi:pilus assembly protein Flp/PilA [Mesorhizobium shonense]|uniref:Pilus assembly protein Flp/PilA n=1 Tax=Mesorhizobium shonense TaxID=1209948 RepID=A0ABV2HRE1_9HYPH|nr:Flp family type IVb pilin [Mesorhizobium sp.]TIS50001.1 MAG: Flp family type IVb pilin [Mesorhizobium sp.]
MKKLMTMARQFRDDDNGAAMVEYSILIGIITAAAIAFIVGVGIYVTDAWSTLCTTLKSHDAAVTCT